MASELPPGTTAAEDTESYIGIPDDYRAQRVVTQRRRGTAMDRGTPAPIVGPTNRRLGMDEAPITNAAYPSNNADPKLNTRFVPDSGTTARYKSGEERTLLAGKSPEAIAGLQRQLVNAGLITGKVVLGVWDDTSATAFRQVLSIANVNGYNVDEALQYVATQAANPENVIGAASRAPLTVSLTDPRDLSRIFQQAAEATMGRRVDQADIDKMVGSYQGMEQSYQQTAYGQQETGGTVTAPPSAGAFAESELEKTNPGEVGAASLASTFDSFLEIIGGAGS